MLLCTVCFSTQSSFGRYRYTRVRVVMSQKQEMQVGKLKVQQKNLWVEKILVTWKLLEILGSWSINIFLSFPPKWGLCLSLILLSTAWPAPPHSTGMKNENILSPPLFFDSQWFPKLSLNWQISQLYAVGKSRNSEKSPITFWFCCWNREIHCCISLQ